ncbi:MAG: hypothetical protein KGI54_16300 [Pseudomonadota bacterium]|nr:hypothetical protein [Pseudomonadota bacterium]
MGHRSWTPEEKQLLLEKWKTCRTWKEVSTFFPDRTPNGVKQKAVELGYEGLPNLKRPSGTNWPVIMAALKTRGPMHTIEISSYTGIPRSTVMKVIKAAHARGEVYISAWGSNAVSGYWPRIWAYGVGDDAPRPRAISRKISWTRRSEKIKHSPEIKMKRNAQARRRYWDKKRAEKMITSVFNAA